MFVIQWFFYICYENRGRWIKLGVSLKMGIDMKRIFTRLTDYRFVAAFASLLKAIATLITLCN